MGNLFLLLALWTSGPWAYGGTVALQDGRTLHYYQDRSGSWQLETIRDGDVIHRRALRTRQELDQEIQRQRETQRKFVVFLDQSVQGLLDKPCFKAWIAQLKSEGITPDIEIADPRNADAKYYTSKIRGDHEGSILIGDFKLPEISLEGEKDPVQSALPLMSPSGSYSNLKRWVGVIRYGNSIMSDAWMVDKYCEYFSRNVAFRTCKKSDRPLRVVGFVDDDWTHFYDTNRDFMCLSTDCAAVDAMAQLKTTTSAARPADYCSISVHSTPTSHRESVGSTQVAHGLEAIAAMAPNARFFNLFACSAGKRVSDKPNVAETYLFETPSAIGVLASTRPGSVYDFKVFHRHLVESRDFGQAYLRYLRDELAPARRDVIGHAFLDQRFHLEWESGLVFYGDPTLGLQKCDWDELERRRPRPGVRRVS